MPNFPQGITCATSTVADGNMSFRFGSEEDVVNNRENFLRKLAVNYASYIPMACDNGSKISVINDTDFAAHTTPSNQASMLLSEVLITAETNLPLMLLTADCIPASFYDPVNQVIALAHLNRHTIAHDLAAQTVAALKEKFNTQAKDLLIHFGPYIHTESYVFPLPLDNPAPVQLADFILKKNETVQIDLRSAFIHQLTQAGVTKTNITTSPSNTGNSAQYFSHYRTTREPNYPAGRMATVLMMK